MLKISKQTKIKLFILILFITIVLTAFLSLLEFYQYKLRFWRVINTNFCQNNCGLNGNPYFWQKNFNRQNSLCEKILPPTGYKRTTVNSKSFAEWLRCLPLKEGKHGILLYNGKQAYQFPHQGIIDIDVGDKDLQQCADAVIRLRAEYLFANGDYEFIRFNFVSGFTASYLRWQEGWRPIVVGNIVKELKSAFFDDSWLNFRGYLNAVFNYANTFSLEKELMPILDVNQMQIGDVFIQGGFPGHAAIVIDMAQNEHGEKIFLLAQSNRPAQGIHITKDWYPVNFGEVLEIPGWQFKKENLRRFVVEAIDKKL